MRIRSAWVIGMLGMPCLVSAEIIEEIVARVNDQVITMSELEEREGLMIQELFQNFAGEELDRELAEGRENLLRDLIAEKLLLERGAALLDMERVRESLLQDFMKRQGIEDRQELEEILKRQDTTVEEFVENLVRVAVPQEMLNYEVRSQVEVTEEEMRAHYEENREDYARPETVRFREIVLLAPGEDRSGVRERLTGIREEILRGADFVEAVETNSDAPSRDQGGLVGPFQRRELRSEISDIAFSLEEGEVSEVIELPHGFHLIRMEEHLERRIPSFEETEEEIRNLLMERKGETAVRDYITRLWKESYVYLYPRYRHRVPTRFLELSAQTAEWENPESP